MRLIKQNRHIVFLLVILIFTIIGDRLFGYTLETLYYSKSSRANEKLIVSTYETKADILIFGSSRAENHYNPLIISQQTNLSCYNLGFGGQNIYFHNGLLKSILERYTPKVIVLELFEIDFEMTGASHDKEKLGVLMPLYDRSEAIKSTVLLRGQSEKIKNISKIYPFNSLIYKIIRNNYFPIKNDINGYLPLDKSWVKEIEKDNSEIRLLDSTKIEALFDFIKTSLNAKSKLIIAVSPQFMTKDNSKSLQFISAKIKNEFGVEVLIYLNDIKFLDNKSLFSDPLHLNFKGAKLYSEIISDRILDVLN